MWLIRVPGSHDHAQKGTVAADWRSVGEATRELEGCSVFLDPIVVEEENKRLCIPGRTVPA